MRTLSSIIYERLFNKIQNKYFKTKTASEIQELAQESTDEILDNIAINSIKKWGKL